MTHEEQDVFVPFANGATVVAMPMPPAAPPPPPAPPQDGSGSSRNARAQDARSAQGQGQPAQGQTTQGQTVQGQSNHGQSTQGQTSQGQSDQGQSDQGPAGQRLSGQGQTSQDESGQAHQGQTVQGQSDRGQSDQGLAGFGQPEPGHSGQGQAIPGFGLPDQLRSELHELFTRAGGQVQSVYQAHINRPDLTSPAALLPFTDCATAGAVAGRLALVDAVFHGRRPGGPSTARQTASAVRLMLKNAPDASRAHLTGVLAMLDELASDPGAAQREDAELGASAGRLEERLRTSPGVYVYTYPHYWRHAYVPGTERRLLKVGRGEFAQVRAQARQIGAPEDPLLLRVYVAAEPGAVERSFHRLLDAAEHTRGEEWFSTTVEFCDEIATALQLEILEADVPA